MNNLDPGVAERPEDLIVYGGSGKPVGTFQTHPGAQGILQGTYETLAAVAQRHFDGTLSGRIVVTAGLGSMGGAQPLAVTMNGGVVRHADAGYRQAIQTARDHGVRIPMQETSR